jgi:D-alanyl-D-alanine carboxypeptidase (penicillin-binding protein 5/6)
MIITEEASQIIGTTAKLEAEDTLSYLQLLYGTMLPSGNDAAFSIAEHFGNVLVEFKYSKCSAAIKDKVKSFYYGNKHVVRFFLKEMNMHAKDLGMNDSYFDSPHGLMNRFN